MICLHRFRLLPLGCYVSCLLCMSYDNQWLSKSYVKLWSALVTMAKLSLKGAVLESFVLLGAGFFRRISWVHMANVLCLFHVIDNDIRILVGKNLRGDITPLISAPFSHFRITCCWGRVLRPWWEVFHPDHSWLLKLKNLTSFLYHLLCNVNIGNLITVDVSFASK